MSKEIKMSDYFDLPVSFDIDLCKIHSPSHNLIEAKAISLNAQCQAINNHDRLVEENKRLREERDEAIELAKRANKGYSHMIKLHNNYLSEQITSTDLNEPDYIDYQDVYEIGRDVFMLENGLSEEDIFRGNGGFGSTGV